jgi:hypothetical protein
MAWRYSWKVHVHIAFIRAFGREVAERHGIPNTSENDIKKALGPYYEEWR